jgi:hypothetical protein
MFLRGVNEAAGDYYYYKSCSRIAGGQPLVELIPLHGKPASKTPDLRGRCAHSRFIFGAGKRPDYGGLKTGS